MDHPDDYQYWETGVEENPGIFRSKKSFKWELSCYRDEWRKHGVIVETGAGEQRKRVLVSRSRYIDYFRQRTKARAV